MKNEWIAIETKKQTELKETALNEDDIYIYIHTQTQILREKTNNW